MSLWHRHNWNLIDKTLLPSAFEQMKDTHSLKATESASRIFRKALVLTFKRGCGAVKMLKESNP